MGVGSGIRASTRARPLRAASLEPEALSQDLVRRSLVRGFFCDLLGEGFFDDFLDSGFFDDPLAKRCLP